MSYTRIQATRLIFFSHEENHSIGGFHGSMIFLQARESFVITTGIDTKLGSAPKSKVGISRTSDREVFFSENMPEGSGAIFGCH